MANKQQGMTLVEVLIGLMITAMIGMISFNALQATINTQKIVAEQTESLQELQLLGALWSEDLKQAIARPILDEYGVQRGAMEAGVDSLSLIEFTRSGQYRSPEMPVSSLERISYKLDGDKLIRDVWLWLDRLESEPSYSLVVLTKVESVELLFYQQNQRILPYDRWTSAIAKSPDQLPLAVEIILNHEVFGEVKRFVYLKK